MDATDGAAVDEVAVEEVAVVAGTGTGRTELGAFDAALAAAGVADYNLVRFSSVLPPGATVVEAGTHDGRYGVGRPVGVVLAEATVRDPGATAAAGLGWATATEGGVFYEAAGESAADCRRRLRAGLADARRIRDWDWDRERAGDPVGDRDPASEGDPAVVVRECGAGGSDGEAVGAAVVAAVFGPLAFAPSPADTG